MNTVSGVHATMTNKSHFVVGWHLSELANKSRQSPEMKVEAQIGVTTVVNGVKQVVGVKAPRTASSGQSMKAPRTASSGRRRPQGRRRALQAPRRLNNYSAGIVVAGQTQAIARWEVYECVWVCVWWLVFEGWLADEPAGLQTNSKVGWPDDPTQSAVQFGKQHTKVTGLPNTHTRTPSCRGHCCRCCG